MERITAFVNSIKVNLSKPYSRYCLSFTFFILTLISNCWINLLTFTLRIILLMFTCICLAIFRDYLSAGMWFRKVEVCEFVIYYTLCFIWQIKLRIVDYIINIISCLNSSFKRKFSKNFTQKMRLLFWFARILFHSIEKLKLRTTFNFLIHCY